MIQKLRDQILELSRRGYRRDQMCVRLTQLAHDLLTLEMREHASNLVAPTARPSLLDGVPLQVIPGILPTAYAMVPYVDVKLYDSPRGGRYVIVVDADRRLLDDPRVRIGDQMVTLDPVDLTSYPQARVDISARIKQVVPISE